MNSTSAYLPTARTAEANAREALTPALLFAAIFVPGHLFGWLVEWLWLAATCAVGALAIAKRGVRGSLAGWSATTWLTLLGVAAASSALTVVASVGVRHAAFEARDLAELFRLPIYALFCIVLASASERWNAAAIDRVIAWSVAFVIACTVVYATRIPLAYEFLDGFLYSDAKVMFGAGYVRISFPFANPNFLAFYLLLVLAYTAFFSPRPLVFLGTLVALFLTGSRSGWLAALPVLAVAYATYAYRASTRSLGLATVLVWLIPLAAVGLAIRYAEQLQQFSRLAELIQALGEGSVSQVQTADVRLAEAGQLLHWVERAPLLGWGPGRSLGIDVADNQYLSWALAWGTWGLTLMIATLGMLFWRVVTTARDARRWLGAAAFALSVAAMLFTGDFLENYRLFFILAAVAQASYLAHASSEPTPPP